MLVGDYMPSIATRALLMDLQKQQRPNESTEEGGGTQQTHDEGWWWVAEFIHIKIAIRPYDLVRASNQVPFAKTSDDDPLNEGVGILGPHGSCAGTTKIPLTGS